MAKHIPSQAEKDFFAAFLDDRPPLAKQAVELDPSVAQLLEIPAGAEAQLDQLEAEAAGIDRPPPVEPDDGSEQAAAADADDGSAPAPAPVDVVEFNRTDEEPEADEDDTSAAPDLPGRLTHGRLFMDKRGHPLQMLTVLEQRYQTEWVDWEPVTLWWALRRDFGPVGEVARNKVMALRMAVSTDVPWLDWDTFENSGLAWNDIIPRFGEFQPMSPAQMAFTVQVLRSIRAEEEFDPEVGAYIAAILEDYGWVYAPEAYFGPVPQTLMDRKTRLIGLREQVAMAWERIQNVDPDTIEWRVDNPIDIHLRKLMVVRGYLSLREKLREVLPGSPGSSTTAAPPVP